MATKDEGIWRSVSTWQPWIESSNMAETAGMTCVPGQATEQGMEPDPKRVRRSPVQELS